MNKDWCGDCLNSIEPRDEKSNWLCATCVHRMNTDEQPLHFISIREVSEKGAKV
jgi:hypothetical protein